MTAQVQARPIERRRVSTPGTAAARSRLGLPDVPTIVAIGPFDDPQHTNQLTGALAALRLRCQAQLVFLGGDVDGSRWSDLIAAADVVVPSSTTGFRALLDVMTLGRPVVAPANPCDWSSRPARDWSTDKVTCRR